MPALGPPPARPCTTWHMAPRYNLFKTSKIFKALSLKSRQLLSCQLVLLCDLHQRDRGGAAGAGGSLLQCWSSAGAVQEQCRSSAGAVHHVHREVSQRKALQRKPRSSSHFQAGCASAARAVRPWEAGAKAPVKQSVAGTWPEKLRGLGKRISPFVLLASLHKHRQKPIMCKV